MKRVLALAVLLAACGSDRPISDEQRTRERWIGNLMQREGLSDAWSLASRYDLQFEDGLAPVEMIDPDLPFTGWDEVGHQCESTPAKPVRWMGARAHLRIRGDRDGDRTLVIRGRVDVKGIQTRPVVAASLDGREIHSEVVDPDGYFVIAATVPGAWITDWADLYLTLSSVDEPWKDPEGRAAAKLTVARLESVTWEPVTPRSP